MRPSDLEYCSELLNDFVKRAQNDPDGLFKQICSLSVGPLITFFTGDRLDRSSVMGLLWENFVDLA